MVNLLRGERGLCLLSGHPDGDNDIVRGGVEADADADAGNNGHAGVDADGSVGTGGSEIVLGTQEPGGHEKICVDASLWEPSNADGMFCVEASEVTMMSEFFSFMDVEGGDVCVRIWRVGMKLFCVVWSFNICASASRRR